ncbi:hypothetical protein BU16DRAFT_617604 [Lophium mytilinum]|uniref:Uncharacterized protein n=1 Tax=Lophium mytilinum TaxID=390894 RepID=A0A6A6QUM5_9PEZI|nr:hypothetical protein BU16DRAFT_617604 [Lophium mytilinum]
MGPKFFQDWALWEKMTFVLACAIGVTIFAGFCKLTYANWRLRKYDQADTAKALQTLELLEAQNSEEDLKTDEKEDVPFGIRAIESGIQIDGVWISRGNTPIGSVASSFDESRATSSRSESAQLEVPQQVYGSSSRSSSKAPSSAFEQAVSAERIPSSRSASSSSASSTYSLHHADIQPEIHDDIPLRNSSALLALEGLDSRKTPSLVEPNSSSSSTSSATSSHDSDETDYMAIPRLQIRRPYEPAYIKPSISPVLAVDSKWNLDLLQSHRLSHVAETGQLTPRIRRPVGSSGEWSSIVVPTRNNEVALSAVEQFTPHQKSSSLPLPAALDMFPIPPQRASVPPLTKEGQSLYPASQIISPPNTYRPRGEQSDPEINGLSSGFPSARQANDSQYVQHTYQPYESPVRVDETEQQLNPATQQNRRDAQVLRKVNSGFEILRPGTFTFADEPTLHDTGSSSGEKRQSRRLRKKRPGSSDYGASSFADNV